MSNRDEEEVDDEAAVATSGSAALRDSFWGHLARNEQEEAAAILDILPVDEVSRFTYAETSPSGESGVLVSSNEGKYDVLPPNTPEVDVNSWNPQEVRGALQGPRLGGY